MRILGLDLGQAQDYTALAVVEQDRREVPEELAEQRRAEKRLGVRAPGRRPADYRTRHLERLPLGTPYPAVVERVAELLPRLGGEARLVVDATGVGRPVLDMMKRKGLRPVPITITAGDSARLVNGHWRVPKRDLASIVQVLLQERRLRIAAALPQAQILVEELLNFRVRIDPSSGRDSYAAWRESAHDDLVLALACAVWWGERTETYRVEDYRIVRK